MIAASIAQGSQTALPWWLWPLFVLALLLVSWWRNRHETETTPAAKVAAAQSDVLQQTLLGAIPALSVDQRAGLAQSIINALGLRGFNEQTLKDTSVDMAAARSGVAIALSALVRRAGQLSPLGLGAAVATYARNTPSFLTTLPSSTASALRGSVGKSLSGA